MNMKTLKMYESPKMEVVKLKSQGALMAGSDTGGGSNTPGGGDSGED